VSRCADVSDPLIRPQILHVDDEADALEQVRTYLEKEDIPEWGRPDVIGINSFDRALMMLEERRFDLMILDVRMGDLHKDIAEEEEGVRTLNLIKERRFLPVVFWTGLPSKVQHLNGPLVHVLEKTGMGGLDSLVRSVRDLFSTGLPRLNRALLRLVEREQSRYMWHFVAKHWDRLSEADDDMALAYLLVRRLGRSLSGPGIESLATEIGSDGRKGPSEGKIHAAEMYLIPPLADTSPAVGDLYCESNEGRERWWLVITPTCDFQERRKSEGAASSSKAERVVLAACGAAGEHPDVLAWWRKDRSKPTDDVRALITHATGGQRDRYLFLPAAFTVPDLVADFQRVENVDRARLQSMERVASLVSPFAEAMVSRFVRYFGRVGTDDLDDSELLNRLREARPNDAEKGTAAAESP